MKIVKGWKNTDKDLKCRGFQLEVGKEYHQNGKIELCGKGFHFHENRFDIFKYYNKDDSLVVEVEAFGDIETGDDKSVCSDIKIIRVLDDEEIKELCNLKTNTGSWNSGDWNSGYSNSGDRNSGYRNSGDRNSGNRNSGDRNSGNWNSGSWNSGDWNSGYSNSGDRNSGYRNSGDRNSGYRNSGNWNSGNRNSGNRNSGNWNSGNRNSGNRNSGDWNSGYRNSGYRNSGYRNSGDRNSGNRNSGNWNKSNFNTGHFNTKEVTEILVFNKPCNKEKWDMCEKPSFIYFDLTLWIPESKMSDQEKKDHACFCCQEGYLKTLGYKEAWRMAWENRADGDIEKLEALPNFDWEVFTEITGIEKP